MTLSPAVLNVIITEGVVSERLFITLSAKSNESLPNVSVKGILLSREVSGKIKMIECPNSKFIISPKVARVNGKDQSIVSFQYNDAYFNTDETACVKSQQGLSVIPGVLIELVSAKNTDNTDVGATQQMVVPIFAYTSQAVKGAMNASQNGVLPSALVNISGLTCPRNLLFIATEQTCSVVVTNESKLPFSLSTTIQLDQIFPVEEVMSVKRDDSVNVLLPNESRTVSVIIPAPGVRPGLDRATVTFSFSNASLPYALSESTSFQFWYVPAILLLFLSLLTIVLGVKGVGLFLHKLFAPKNGQVRPSKAKDFDRSI